MNKDTPEIRQAFDNWMSALVDYNHAMDTRQPEHVCQQAYDVMKAHRTQYRTLRKKHEE